MCVRPRTGTEKSKAVLYLPAGLIALDLTGNITVGENKLP